MSTVTDYFARSLRLRKDHQIDRQPLTPSDSDLTLDELYESNDSFASSFNESEDEGDKVQVTVKKRRSPQKAIGSKGKGKAGPSKGTKGIKSAEGAGPGVDEPFVDPFPDFQWMTTEEPHRSRRMAILKAHPEVSPLLTV